MTNVSIEAFFLERQKQLTMQVHLYALVDGLLFADAAGGSSPRRSHAAAALFDGTPDASLAEAGPWLFDWERESGSVRHSLSAMAGGSTGVSWLISAYPIESLADELRRRLDVRLRRTHAAGSRQSRPEAGPGRNSGDTPVERVRHGSAARHPVR
ncbi:DUF4123 domain-containing protein [Burkholderia multivorans]|nr:DUF4123 domain-containing protein [Burkholderia multivorans]MDN7404227.1 DUF4123 domain-containing protein [Burkholderia multivorans]MDN7418038.1 DUF4123 domain-containing protein [Burkholderia multivorans]MDN7650910.1 DUF4123 domain-containing protein [Burkholderia multivorans]MDN7688635.1 DUF4123 domain-containing protein [Burkholderia multivorans]